MLLFFNRQMPLAINRKIQHAKFQQTAG